MKPFYYFLSICLFTVALSSCGGGEKPQTAETTTTTTPETSTAAPTTTPEATATAPVGGSPTTPEAAKPEAGKLGAPTTVATSAAKGPQCQFGETLFNFGTVTDGEKVVHEFKFKNTGSAPLEIQNAQASCSCTKAEYPFTPIMPGAEGVIKMIIDTKGKSGNQSKAVTVTTNADPKEYKLSMLGVVNAASGK